ncbi:MAG: glycoside hydrolase family 88 protein [Bacteroidales bacterium]|nr:glycoside hydrolase family 88 protein [Bacteroidales bacterium]
MKRMVLASLVIIMAAASCGRGTGNPDWVDNGIETASEQLKLAASLADGTGRVPMSLTVPKDIEKMGVQIGRDTSGFTESQRHQSAPERWGSLETCDIYSWVSGFFAGSLWYAYEFTGDEALREKAVQYTNLLAPVQYYTKNHDIGFMIETSYGNALRLAPNDTIKSVIIRTAESLITRFDPTIGCIRSWDFGDWNYPVIIDNMMNLELLFHASELSGDPKYRDIAVSHANTTLQNHFRDDYTSYHVVSYNADGTVQSRGTHQGRSDDSAWARGQAWGLYGYTMCFRETADSTYLTQAGHIADMIMEKVTTDDAVPYWDYSAPALPDTPRDASAAAITASALLELSAYVDADASAKYFAYAEKILRALSSPAYLSPKGENQGFILLHSVGAYPQGNQIDTPLNYADYYYLEALHRYVSLLKES